MALVPTPPGPAIVVCADNDALRRVFASYARAQGCTVREATSGAAALDALQGDTPVGLLIDLVVPGEIDGCHVLRRIRCDRRLRSMRVVATAPSLGPSGDADHPRDHEIVVKPLPPGAVLRQLLGDEPGRGPEALCIFVVEDHEDSREMMIEALAASGLYAFGFASGAHVLSALRAIRPAAILTDYGLPDLNGEELARRARALAPGVPVVALTGHAHVVRRCAGFDAAFLKPFELDEVVAAVRGLALRAPRG